MSETVESALAETEAAPVVEGLPMEIAFELTKSAIRLLSLGLLIADDSKEAAELLVAALRRGGYDVTFEVVDTMDSMRAALERRDWDVITSDHAMPDLSASAALALAKQLRPDAPFIIVSGEIDLNLAVSLIRGGARDFIQKREMARLVPAVDRALQEITSQLRRRRAETGVETSEACQRGLFDAAHEGILILDGDTGAIIDVNPFLVETLGYPREAILGKKLWEIGAVKDATVSRAAFTELQAKGYIRYDDLPLRKSDGTLLSVEFVNNVDLVDRKKVIQCNIRDITPRASNESEIRKDNIELERRVLDRTNHLEALNAELETFSYSVSHDLRAPLRHIGGFVEVLREHAGHKLDSVELGWIQKILAATVRMDALIDALLALARSSGKSLDLRILDLSALCKGIAAELRGGEGECTRSIDFVIAEGITAVCDEQMVRIVMENLLDNAWKFTAQRERARIEFGVSSRPTGSVVYFVRDNGVGFDMSHADKLFAAFQRLHTEKEFSGSGIGLATVQRAIHHCGGRIWAEGGVDAGATFFFTLQ